VDEGARNLPNVPVCAVAPKIVSLVKRSSNLPIPDPLETPQVPTLSSMLPTQVNLAGSNRAAGLPRIGSAIGEAENVATTVPSLGAIL
jgi:hypothetical protein